jgi:hypothetical protein
MDGRDAACKHRCYLVSKLLVDGEIVDNSGWAFSLKEEGVASLRMGLACPRAVLCGGNVR